MRFHIAMSKFFDFKEFYKKCDEGLGPRPTMFEMAQQLGAKIHQPETSKANIIDWILSRFISQPSHWSLARAVLKEIRKEDVVYCAGEDIGVPIAVMFKLFGVKSKLGINFADPEGIRAKFFF